MARRSVDRLGRGADLSDDVLPVPQRRARRQSVRAQGTRQHLHAHHEPDQRRAGEAHRGARGRRRGAGGGERPGGFGLRGAESRAGRRQYRLLHRPLRRHLEPVRQYAEGSGHRSALRRSRRPRELPPRHRRAHPRLLRRDPAEPEADRLPDRRGGGDRPAARHSADRRQHRGAAADAPVRSRRGDRSSIPPTKYLGGHGTSIGGLIVDGGNFPWERFRRAPAGAQHARSELSRRGVERGGQAARADRLYHQGARHAAARPRLGALAVQRLPDPAGHRDAGAAHRAPQRERRGGRRTGSPSGRK